MSLSDANKIQENANVTTGSSHSVTLPSGTTAGNTLIVITYSQTDVTAPAGISADVGLGNVGEITYWRKPPDALTGGETSWTFTTGTSNSLYWRVAEYSNIDGVAPVDATASGSNVSLGNGATLSTGTTAQTAGLSVLALASWAVDNTGSWGSQTNSFTEVSDVNGSVSHVAVAELYQNGATGTFSSTATNTTGQAAQASVARIVVYRAADSPIDAPIYSVVGFRWGTNGGMGNTSASNPVGTGPAGGTWNTHYQVGTGYARDGGSGLRLINTGSIPTASPNSPGVSEGFNVRLASGSGVQVVRVISHASVTGGLQLVYDFSTNKLGVRWGTSGTASWQSGTTALNATHIWFDWRAKNGAAGHVDWWLEGVAQTSPADATLSATNFSFPQFGLSTNGTWECHISDFVASKHYVAGPLGVHTVKLLVPETTGASVSGTAANFNEFTANGTLAAFASTSGQRIDEVPPTISASSDGVVQVAVAASDYMNFPMTTYTCAYNEVVAAVRALFSEWGGTGTGTGTIGYRGHDGTTETTFVAASASYDADSLTAASSTYPLWKSAMWTNSWTQAKLNAAALRVGFSTDATPDMGISAAYLEVAIKTVPPVRQITVEDPISATVDVVAHPYNSATVSYVVTNNDATRSVNFNYSLAGTPQTPVTVSPSSNQTVQLNADAFGDVSDLSLEPQ